MAYKASSLTIRVRFGETSSLTLERDGEIVLRSENGLPPARLVALRKEAGDALDLLRTQLADIRRTSFPKASAALVELHRRGRYILHDLFGRSSEGLDRLAEASRICREACPGWNLPDIAPPLIRLDASLSDGLIPEMLPLLNPRPTVLPATKDELFALAASFLGFAAIVQRGRAGVTGQRLANSNGLPISLFWHSGLNLASSVRSWFEQSGQFQLAEIWPATRRCKDGVGEVARRLIPRQSPASASPLPAVQIHHFHCHCDSAPPPGSPSLRLRSDVMLSQQQWISARDLLNRLTDIRAAGGAADDARSGGLPLVFLNACASGAVDPERIGSFVETFEHGFAGLIATDAIIPEPFAHEFSKTFYSELLKGATIGEALYRARWAMLRVYNSPLGLLYGMFADPDIRVLHPVQAAA